MNWPRALNKDYLVIAIEVAIRSSVAVDQFKNKRKRETRLTSSRFLFVALF